VAWRALRHPNVLSLLGVTMAGTRLVMVSEWMVGGDINEFVKANINADRLGLVRFSFKVLSMFVTDNYMITVAWRRYQRVDLHA